MAATAASVAQELRQVPEQLPGAARAGGLAPLPLASLPKAAAGGATTPMDLGASWMLQLGKANGARFGARAMSQARTDNAADVEVLPACDAMRAWRRSPARTGRVALVPTMGNLHEGHLELVDEARRQADEVLVSIFVNPSQFAPHEDLDRYPRTFQRDLELLRSRGAAAVFAPTPDDMYPGGSPGGVVVTPSFVEGKNEAACRPFHFSGVATVCLKLFNLCRPDVAIFGQKDAMQCVVISRMLEDLMLDSQVSLVIAPTSRESDGLARSSRNAYLTPGMRSRAPAIYAALTGATQAVGATPGSVRKTVREQLEAVGMEVNYISVADRRDMSEKADGEGLADSVVSVACLLEEDGKQCRLIDNVLIPRTV